MAHDKRRFVRIPVRVDFYVEDESSGESGQLFFPSRNVSLGGAFLASDFLLETGTPIHVRFTLPGASPIETDATVAWVSDDGDDGAGMGIEFTSLAPAELAAIKRFIERHAPARV